MKRSVLLILIVLLMLASLPVYYCDASDNRGILSDLSLLNQLEGERLEEYVRELEYRYNESVRIRRLMKDYYEPSGIKDKPVNANEVLYILGSSSRTINDGSLLFRDSIFQDYYRLRTAGVLEEYRESGNIDLASFVGRSQNEFDKYISEARKDSSKKDRITLLLQDKLVDRMYSDDMENKSGYFDKVLAIRTAARLDERNRSIYELMESRVRLGLLEELVSINKEALKVYLKETRALVRNDKEGVLSFRHISDIEKRTFLDYSVYLPSSNSGYKVMLPLGKLISIHSQAAFKSESGEAKIMSRDSIWSSIHMGAEGLELNLNEAYISEDQLPVYDIYSLMPQVEKAVDTSRLPERGKSLNNGQEAVAREIAESLCALDSYSQLRIRGISNAYTAKFEAGKAAWQAELNAKLKRMNGLAAGAKEPDTSFVGFLSYIWQYVDYSRECAAAGLPESSQVLRFRDSVLQFRTVDEGALWILDMLYKLKYLQI